MNLLQFTTLLSLIYVMIQFTAPNQTCSTMLRLYQRGPYHCIAVAILALIDQFMTYYMCYKYAKTSQRIKVTTGRIMTTESNLYESQISILESKIGFDELIRDT